MALDCISPSTGFRPSSRTPISIFLPQEVRWGKASRLCWLLRWHGAEVGKGVLRGPPQTNHSVIFMGRCCCFSWGRSWPSMVCTWPRFEWMRGRQRDSLQSFRCCRPCRSRRLSTSYGGTTSCRSAAKRIFFMRYRRLFWHCFTSVLFAVSVPGWSRCFRESLRRTIERRTKEEFELASAQLRFLDQSNAVLRPFLEEERRGSVRLSPEDHFPLRRGGQLVGVLHAEPHGAGFSGETRAALEFLCEQLPGALDLCRLIEEKLRLERELAERERLALVGQMAASISHNLKNPLGSMKTILQVQLENPELPESIRGETKMVLEEIGRLSTKLNQLLQFSRPAVRGG